MNDLHKGCLFIANAWKSGSGEVFVSHNPATGEILWKGREASEEEVEEAVLCAQEAFKTWSKTPLQERFSCLLHFTSLLRTSGDHLAAVISKETGKPLWDSIKEVEAMINKGAISLEAYKQRCEETIRIQPQGRLITRHRPHGATAVLGPYNFPGHLPNGHIMPALLAGNTVVFKPSELTPLVAEETFYLWQQAGLPPGVLNLIQGGRKTGQALIEQRGLQGLFFTGSLETGQFLSQSFAKEPWKILALEMGGNNPLVAGQISDISDIQAAAHLIVQSAYLSSGQRCTSARRLIIPNSPLSEKLITTLIEKIQSISVGPYTDRPEPFMGPVISDRHAHQILEAEEALEALGGVPLIKMRLLKAGTGFISPGLMDTTAIAKRPDDEIFGPFLQVIRVDNFKEAVAEANRTKFGLSAGLISTNWEEWDAFYGDIQAGVVSWNAPLTGASSHAPFGGIKCSGNHRPSAFYAADYCAYPIASQEIPELKMP